MPIFILHVTMLIRASRLRRQISGFPIDRIKDVEVATLKYLGFSIYISDDNWSVWLGQLHAYASSYPTREPIGILISTKLAVRRLEDLMKISRERKDHPKVIEDTLATGMVRDTSRIE